MEAQMSLLTAGICSSNLFAVKNAPTCKIQRALLPAEFKYLLKWPFSQILLDLKAHRGSDDFVNTVNLLNGLVGTENTPTCKILPVFLPAEYKYLLKWPFSYIL